MLTSIVVRTVEFSIRHAWRVIFAALLLCAGSAVYVAQHFAINTDTGRLIDPGKPWAKRGAALDAAFPQRDALTLVVVEAPAVEFAEQAAAELAGRLKQNPARFSAVSRPGGGEFFTRNGLMFLSVPQLTDLTGQLTQARPLLNALAHDPTLAGLANTLSVLLLLPLQIGQVHLADMAPLLGRSADAIDQVLAGRPAALSWRALIEDGATEASDVPTSAQTSAHKDAQGSEKGSATGDAKSAKPVVARSLVAVRPMLDYGTLEAGQAAAGAIRVAAAELHLDQRYHATVRLTGATPLADEEFASVQDGAALNGVLTLLTVLLILWLALRSAKMVFAVLVTMLVGLVVTAALGLWMVGALNMISVAFAVLFVGIGVDFGIQFGVRYREERHAYESAHAAVSGARSDSASDGLRHALRGAARAIAMPLGLAALATAASFFSFLPTDYRGVSELGQIAGVGILCVAFPSSLTLLPALIAVLGPRSEPATPGFVWLAPVDRLFARHRTVLLYGTLALVLAGAPLLLHLRFDFNPLHLKNTKTESMATLLALQDAPEVGINNVNVLAPSLDAARAVAQRLAALPQVGRVVTLDSFIPEQQDAKLKLVADAARTLLPVLTQTPAAPADDAARVSAKNNAARLLRNAALDHPGPGAGEAQHLSATLLKLASADVATRDAADHAIAEPLRLALATLRVALAPQPISRQTLPPDLVRDWLTPDGRALVDIAPKVGPGQDPSDDTLLHNFAEAVLRAEPTAIGGPITILESASTIITAFIQAGAWALLSITLLLWITLRRLADVLRTLVPLLVSAAVTLELSVLFGIPLNFANIIALPLLLGIGVAFKIYYVIAWRNGQTDLLQTSLTQAVILSAATTATAFGSLWLSHHPGTASMGRLLALSLLCTLIGAVFFQPVLMGKPRGQTPGQNTDKTRDKS